MKVGGGMERRTPLTRRTPLVARVGLHRVPFRPARRKADVPASVRREVRARSGGLCECGCGQRAEHMHHRKLRSQGGRHEAVNLLHLTNEHHALIHANPDRAYALGLLVRASFDPADVPVVKGALS